MDVRMRVKNEDGTHRQLTVEEMDEIERRLLAGERADAIAADYGHSSGWLAPLITTRGLIYIHRDKRYYKGEAGQPTLPVAAPPTYLNGDRSAYEQQLQEAAEVLEAAEKTIAELRAEVANWQEMHSAEREAKQRLQTEIYDYAGKIADLELQLVTALAEVEQWKSSAGRQQEEDAAAARTQEMSGRLGNAIDRLRRALA